MASNGSPLPNTPENDDPQENGGKSDKHRRATLMKAIARLRVAGETWHVEFDAEGHALGKNGAMFRSYLGLLARSKVPITIKVWKQVADEIKN